MRWEKMGELINIEGLISDLKFYEVYCDLIHSVEENFPVHCPGYSGKCSFCEVPKYRKKAGIELTKLKLGV